MRLWRAAFSDRRFYTPTIGIHQQKRYFKKGEKDHGNWWIEPLANPNFVNSGSSLLANIQKGRLLTLVVIGHDCATRRLDSDLLSGICVLAGTQ
jgi:hypothetical protein